MAPSAPPAASPSRGHRFRSRGQRRAELVVELQALCHEVQRTSTELQQLVHEDAPGLIDGKAAAV